MDARELARFLSIQFRYTSFVFGANLEGLTDEDALRQPAPGGNCINWVAGHIVHARAGLVRLVGGTPPYDADHYRRYERASTPITSAADAVALSRIRADFAATRGPLDAGLATLTDDRLADPAPFSPGNNPEETIGTLLAGLAFHEAYHTGQLGVLRRLAGADGAIR
ncbi:MAG TPA: DinB family protein [Candidatus Krumholzibacteria bacterium]|nr:DinB family protein [Candidatus Krumholzibacteria bacterium]